MSDKSFKDLIVWQKSGDVSVEIYRVFLDIKDFGFKDQIQRAAVSVMNNIAEGYAKRSDKGLKNYLLIAKGSNAEVESMLFLAERLGYISPDQQKKLLVQTQEVGKLLSGFINKLVA